MKFLIGILFFLLLPKQSFADDSIEVSRDSLISFATGLKGITYAYGGKSQKGFDCSGIVYYVYKHFNYSVPRSSSSYLNFGKNVELKYCRPGDIIVFTGTKSHIRKPGHVGIVLQNENGIVYFIHSSSSKKNYGVTVTRYNGSGYEKRFLSVKNVLDD